jgi:recombination protein RecT
MSDNNALAVIERQLVTLGPRFEAVLPASLPASRLIQTIVVSCERSPKLLDCDRQSLFNAALSAAVLGLEVDGVSGQAFLIPFKNRAQLVIGYRGFNTLAAKSGITITGACVKEGDTFDYELGTKAYLRHVPRLGNEGRIIGAWACATAPGRTPIVSVLGIDELLAVKQRSPAGARSDSPWNDPRVGFPAMCEKTAKRRLARSMPLNVMVQAAAMDEAVDERGKGAWIDPDRGVVIEGEVLAPRTAETPTAEALIGKPAEMTAHDYVERWHSIIADAQDGRELAELWNSEAQRLMRRAIVWPSQEPVKALMSLVTARVGELKRSAA